MKKLLTLTLIALMLAGLCTAAAEDRPTVLFGQYEQDGNEENGAEPIEWMVLGEEKGYTLLLSLYGLEAMPYNEYYNHTTWAKCSLREWMLNTFTAAAFTEEERAAIQNTQVKVGKKTLYPEYRKNHDHSTHISPGNNTRDRVFLLSYQELAQYLPEPADRACAPTAHAIAGGAYYTGQNGCGWWWLRSMGSWEQTATVIYTSGSIHQLDVCLKDVLVRPAIWVKTDALSAAE